eukprot:CAMPEP_0114548110 /NCGR_PEP_ID=MMETSP0114-20121206/4806_1 /TAXON_ID=31324 /ORGANISM="Goniomonas sp, Strain m" /LENGTH=114 /DNA_ID=CAMNT_0001732677 /DNA_START=31 /DNA_END=376 /DNA_ORIENTATION=-
MSGPDESQQLEVARIGRRVPITDGVLEMKAVVIAGCEVHARREELGVDPQCVGVPTKFTVQDPLTMFSVLGGDNARDEEVENLAHLLKLSAWCTRTLGPRLASSLICAFERKTM